MKRSISAHLVRCGLLCALLGVCLPLPVRAAGVVGDGTPASCTEAAFGLALAAGGTITFNCGPGAHTIVLTSQRTITLDTIIDGGNLIQLSGGNSTRLFRVAAGAELDLRSLVVSNGYSGSADGGAISNDGTLSAQFVVFMDNQANVAYSGGAIVSRGILVLSHATFEHNQAGNGGALFVRDAHFTGIGESSFRDNHTLQPNVAIGGWGGAILAWYGAQVEVTESQFSANSALNGGALYVTANSTLKIATSEVRGNMAGTPAAGASFGGGIYNAGQLQLTDVQVTANTVDDGAILSGDVRGGGGIANVSGGVATISGGVLSGNGGRYGGAVQNFGALTLDGVAVVDNHAGVGGGIFSNGTAAASVAITRSTLSGNWAKYSASPGVEGYKVATPFGAAVANYTAQLSMSNTTISGNGPSTSGTIFDSQGSVALTNVTIANNDGYGLGADSSKNTSKVTLINTLVSANSLGNCGLRFNEFNSQFSLSDDASCSWTGAGNRGVDDAKLTALATNGGATQTQLPALGSAAIDAGTGTGCPATDQRGVPRPQGASCDIGAVERAPADIPSTPSPTPPAPGSPPVRYGTLLPFVQR